MNRSSRPALPPVNCSRRPALLLAALLLAGCPDGGPVPPGPDAGPVPDGGEPAARTVLVRGVVVDLAGAAVENASVTLGADATTTGADGRFALWTVPAAPRTLYARAEGFAGAERRVDPSRPRVSVAPMTLVPLAARGEIDGAAGGTLTGEGLSIVIPPGAFPGTVTIEAGRIPVGDPLLDDDRLPAPLPRMDRNPPAPLLALTLEAEGLQPQAPLQITATGALALPPGTRVPVGRYDVDTGAWVDAGLAVADAEGDLVFETGHLSTFCLALPAVPGADVASPDIDTLTRAPSVFPPGDPRVDPRTGAVQVGVELPALVRRNRELGLVLFHDSRSAKASLPVPVVIPDAKPAEPLLVKIDSDLGSRRYDLDAAATVRADAPPVIVTDLPAPATEPLIRAGPEVTDSLTGTHDVHVSVLRPAEAVLHDSATGSFTNPVAGAPLLDSGGATLDAPSPVPVGRTETRPVAVDDRGRSGFGPGWHLAGLTRLVEPGCTRGEVTLAGGLDAPAQTFGARGELYVEDLAEALREAGTDETALKSPQAIAYVNGAVYVAFGGTNGAEIWRVVPITGEAVRVVGGGETTGCEGLGTDLRLFDVVGLVADPTGQGLLFATQECVGRLDADGNAALAFGMGTRPPGPGVPADDADFAEELRGFVASPSAEVYVIDSWNYGTWVVRNGLLESLRTRVSHPHGPLIAISPDGDLVYGAPEHLCLYRHTDGLSDPELFPGCLNDLPTEARDGPEAEVLHGAVSRFIFDEAGRLWFFDQTFGRLRRLENGVVETVGGADPAAPVGGEPPEVTGVGGPAREARLGSISHIGLTGGAEAALAGWGSLLFLAPVAGDTLQSLSGGDGSSLSRLEDGTWLRILADGTREAYDARGLLVSRGKSGEPPLTWHYAPWPAPFDPLQCGLPPEPPALQRISLSGEDLFTFTWGAGGRLDAITDAAGRRTRISWTGDRPTRIEPPTGPVTFEYDDDGRITARAEAGPDGRLLTDRYAYEDGRLVTAGIRAPGEATFVAAEAAGTVTLDDVDAAGVARDLVIGPAVGEVPTSAGEKAQVTLKADGLSVVNPDGGETDLDTDDLGRLTRTVDPDGTPWAFTRDALGRLIALENEGTGDTWRYTYDGQTDRMRSRTDPAGRTTWFDYLNGRLARRNEPGGVTTTFTYESGGAADGLPTQVADALGRVTRLGYDEHGNTVRFEGPDGAVTEITRDAVGRAARVTEPTGLVHLMAHDPRGGETSHRLGQEADAPVLTHTRVATSAWTASGTRTPATAIVAATGPEGHAWRFERDDAWNQVRLVHPAEGTTYQTFDTGGRRLTRALPEGSTEHFEWTEDRLTRRYFTGPSMGHEARFEHDDEGRVTRILDPLRSERRTYEPGVGWTRLDVTPQTVAPAVAGFSLLRTRVTHAVERRTLGQVIFVVTRGWDGAVESVDLEVGADRSRLLTIERDTARAITRIDRGNGTATVRTYDEAGRVQQQDETSTAGTVSFTWTFDNAGRPATRTAGGVLRTFAYDGLGRLASCSDTGEAYEWDRAGARASAAGLPWTRDAAGRLVTDGVLTYAYDLLGRRTEQIPDGAGADRRSFVWGPGGFLSEVREGAVGAETVLATYRYDGMGRRVRRTTAGGDWFYGYGPDSDRMVRLVEPDGTEWHLLHALPGSAAFTVAATADGRVRYLHVDPLQQVVGISDETGALHRVVTGCFGQVLEQPALSGPAAAFHGMTYDPETELYAAGARFYDPATGEFLSPDPAGLEGGPAPYPYAGGNPVIATDPGGRLLGIAIGALFVGAAILKGIKDYAQGEEVKRAKQSKQALNNFDIGDDDVLDNATAFHKNVHEAADKGGDVAIEATKKAFDGVTNPSSIGDMLQDEVTSQFQDAVGDALGDALGGGEEED